MPHFVLRNPKTGDYQSPRRLQIPEGKSRDSGYMQSESVGQEEARVFTTRAAATRAACDGFIAVEVVLVPAHTYETLAEKAAHYDALCK